MELVLTQTRRNSYPLCEIFHTNGALIALSFLILIPGYYVLLSFSVTSMMMVIIVAHMFLVVVVIILLFAEALVAVIVVTTLQEIRIVVL